VAGKHAPQTGQPAATRPGDLCGIVGAGGGGGQPVDRHGQPAAARSTAAGILTSATCRSGREGPDGPGEGGEPCRSGFFSAHRDNLSPTTAHRRFALTLNLNDGYQGGQLRFPEYGPERYRPALGAALVFSCSHLHEVLDVTAGRRFVLLSFLFGEEAPRPE
jgi:hypothetical protein